MRHIRIIYMTMIAAAVMTVACNRNDRAADKEGAATETPSAGETSAEKPSAERPSPENLRTAPVEKLRVEKIEGFSRTGLLSGDLTVRVCNDTRYAVTVVDGTASLFYAGSKVGALVLCEAVEIPKRATTEVVVPIEVNIGNPLAIYGVWNKVQRSELSEITVTIEATVAAGIIERKFVKRDIPLVELLAAAGVTADDIRNMVK